VREIKDLLQQGDYATSLDLHQAYHHIAVPIQIRPFLAFYFEKKSYQYKSMPFGVVVAPKIFAKTLKIAITEIHKQWKEIRIIVYSDDIFLLHQQGAVLQNVTRQIKRYLEALGWQIAEEKSTLKPTQIFQFLGWQWNSISQTLFMTSQRRRSIISKLKWYTKLALMKQYVKTRKLASILGETQFTEVQLRRGALHLKRIQQLVSQQAKMKGWNSWIRLSPTLIPEFSWWIAKTQDNLQLCFKTPKQWCMIGTDASEDGQGVQPHSNSKQLMMTWGKWRTTSLTSSNQ
ncbi:MAG: putative Transposon Ty3-G Gag-Pol polyprotein, partial [Streblomastix strix]